MLQHHQIALIGRSIAMACAAGSNPRIARQEDPLLAIANLRSLIYLGSPEAAIALCADDVCYRGIPREKVNGYIQATRAKMKRFGSSLWGAAVRYIDEQAGLFRDGHLSEDEFRQILEFPQA